MTSIKISIWDDARDSWRRTRNFPYMCWEFRWTGFVYLGESLMGWPMYKIPMIKSYHQPKMNIRVLYSTIEKQNLN